MSENKFKIGDKVETLKGNGYRDIGSIGVIVEIDESACQYKVEFETADEDGDDYWWYYDGGIQLEQRKQPTKDEILKEVLSDIIKSYYPHLTNVEITIKSDIEIKL